MENTIETINYKNCLISIYQDDVAESPQEWDNGAVLVGYHSDFWIEEKDILSQDEAKELYYYEFDGEEPENKERVKELKKRFWVFGLEAYIHSGVVLAIRYEGNFPDRRWDVSQLGLVLVDKKEAKTEKQARKMADSLIESWNNYLSGNVYGFVAEDEKNGKQIDSCWGFYGDFKESGIIEEAKSSIDGYIKEKRKEAEAKAKDYSQKTLGELLASKDETIKRHSTGILKQLQK